MKSIKKFLSQTTLSMKSVIKHNISCTRNDVYSYLPIICLQEYQPVPPPTINVYIFSDNKIKYSMRNMLLCIIIVIHCLKIFVNLIVETLIHTGIASHLAKDKKRIFSINCLRITNSMKTRCIPQMFKIHRMSTPCIQPNLMPPLPISASGIGTFVCYRF